MFGIGFWELIIIAVVAIIALGPEKLPDAMVKIARFIKVFSKSINEAKRAVEEELNLQELKEDAEKYRSLINKNTKKLKKTISFDELEALQEDAKSINSEIEDIKNSIESNLNEISSTKKAKHVEIKLKEDKEKSTKNSTSNKENK